MDSVLSFRIYSLQGWANKFRKKVCFKKITTTFRILSLQFWGNRIQKESALKNDKSSLKPLKDYDS